MESKFMPCLYFIGEVLDIDGDTGGYNLQAAFSTGFAAAKHIGGSAGTAAGILPSSPSGPDPPGPVRPRE